MFFLTEDEFLIG